ncbi:bacillithiol biosynthesis BshC [Pontibacter sp. BAB1700]|uniref:bacillithiol biosynthesis protein BshC n=1 Tax=Pontibacter sp. BAB1700 TaxID=1144253 RepID=UPI000306129E|nr:bacillithiol biosynthesis BshC [Pontibacter sp. BAB1700]
MEVTDMKITKVDYAATGAFSQTIADYLSQSEKLKTFYHRFPTLEAFSEQIKEKQFSVAQRHTLYQALQEQYGSLADIHQLCSKTWSCYSSPTPIPSPQGTSSTSSQGHFTLCIRS